MPNINLKVVQFHFNKFTQHIFKFNYLIFIFFLQTTTQLISMLLTYQPSVFYNS